MRSKFFFPILSLLFILLAIIYFIVNPSYEKSLKATYYYEIGEYDAAYSLAKEAFGIDVYNRMAATIMAQSKTSLKYVSYINDGKKYMQDIDAIADHDYISDADKAKIKIICEIMLGNYIKLAPSVITDDTLVKDAARYHDEFGKLLEKVNR